MILQEQIPELGESIAPTARLHLNSLHTYYGEATTGQATADVMAELRSVDFDEKFYYINHLHLPITMQKRDGIPITIAPTRSHSSSDLIVRRVVQLKNMSLNSLLVYLNRWGEANNAEIAELRRCFRHIEGGTYREASVMFDYVIRLQDLQDKSGTIYHYQLDTLFSILPPSDAPAHPYSGRFLNIGGFGEKNKYPEQRELNLKIRYVDHSPTASRKYINIAGKVFQITPQKDAPYSRMSAKVNGKRTDMIFPDYLDIFYSGNADPNVVHKEGVGHMRVPVAEARERIGLFDTFDEAANLGNLEAARKERIQQMENNAITLKQQLADEKANLDRQELVFKREMSESKMALERAQQETALLQHRLDNERRDLDMKRRTHDEQLERERREHTERMNAARERREYEDRVHAQRMKEEFEQRSLERKERVENVRGVYEMIKNGMALTTAVASLVLLGGKLLSQHKST